MRESILDLPFPAKGLFISQALDKQPPGTTPQELNVRLYNPRLGRDMGGQRSGLSKYCPTTLGGPIQDINHIVTTFQEQATAGGPFSFSQTSGGTTAFGISNNLGVQQFAGGTSGDVLTCSTWDQAGTLYLGFYNAAGTGVYVKAINTLTNATIWTSATLTVTGGSAGANRIQGMTVANNILYIALQTAVTPAGGIFRLRTGDGTIVDGANTPWAGQGSGSGSCPFFQGGTTLYNNCLGSSSTAVFAIGSNSANTSLVIAYLPINAPNPFNPGISLTLTKAGNNTGCGDLFFDGSRFIYYTDSVYQYGRIDMPNVFGSVGQPNLSWNITGQTGTAAVLSIAGDVINGRIALVGGANVANSGASFCTAVPATGAPIPGTIFNPGGITTWQTVRPSGNGGFILWNQQNASNVIGLNTSLSAAAPGFSLRTLGGQTGFPHIGNAVDFGVALQQQGQVFQSSRGIRGLAVAGGTLYRFTTTSITNKGSFGPQPVAFSSRVMSSQLAQRMYYVDGTHYYLYDAATDTFQNWVATPGGFQPFDQFGYAARLIVTWRNRIVLAGLPYDPLNYFMSAVGDATNWMFNPTPAVETQAVAGNLTSAGTAQDLINCLIPYNDEILIFGLDHTIYQMTGDPAAGGRIDLVTDSIGMAWGQPWCRRPDGVLYFMSSNGSVYTWAPGGIPQRISDAIAELLLTINIGKTAVRLEWSERQRGFHLFLTSLTSYPTAVASTHFFYDAVQEAWHQDQFANTQHNPLATHVFDGDTPGDRVVLAGGFDGFIRKFDQAALDDDGTAIQSNVMLGPLKDKIGNGVTLADLQCDLDAASSPISWAVFAGNSAQAALTGIARQAGTFPLAGRNRSQAVRVFAHAAFVQLIGPGAAAQAWALEYLRVRLRIPEGKARQRIF